MYPDLVVSKKNTFLLFAEVVVACPALRLGSRFAVLPPSYPVRAHGDPVPSGFVVGCSRRLFSPFRRSVRESCYARIPKSVPPVTLCCSVRGFALCHLLITFVRSGFAVWFVFRSVPPPNPARASGDGVRVHVSVRRVRPLGCWAPIRESIHVLLGFLVRVLPLSVLRARVVVRACAVSFAVRTFA